MRLMETTFRQAQPDLRSLFLQKGLSEFEHPRIDDAQVEPFGTVSDGLDQIPQAFLHFRLCVIGRVVRHDDQDARKRRVDERGLKLLAYDLTEHVGVYRAGLDAQVQRFLSISGVPNVFAAGGDWQFEEGVGAIDFLRQELGFGRKPSPVGEIAPADAPGQGNTARDKSGLG